MYSICPAQYAHFWGHQPDLACHDSPVPHCQKLGGCQGGSWITVCDAKTGKYHCRCSAYV